MLTAPREMPNVKMTGPPTYAAKPQSAVVGPRRLTGWSAAPQLNLTKHSRNTGIAAGECNDEAQNAHDSDERSKHHEA